jgi:hypothetical protein
MRSYKVIWSLTAEDELIALLDYIETLLYQNSFHYCISFIYKKLRFYTFGIIENLHSKKIGTTP